MGIWIIHFELANDSICYLYIEFKIFSFIFLIIFYSLFIIILNTRNRRICTRQSEDVETEHVQNETKYKFQKKKRKQISLNHNYNEMYVFKQCMSRTHAQAHRIDCEPFYQIHVNKWNKIFGKKNQRENSNEKTRIGPKILTPIFVFVSLHFYFYILFGFCFGSSCKCQSIETKWSHQYYCVFFHLVLDF